MGRVAHTHIRQQGTSLPGWFRRAGGRQGGPSMLGSARHRHTERMAKKLRSVVRDEVGGVEPRAILARVLTAPLPRGGMSRLYMAAIGPFRHAIVYPSWIRSIQSRWADQVARAG